MQGMFDWVDILESKLDSMSPVGTDLETVKQQIVELKVQSCRFVLFFVFLDQNIIHKNRNIIIVIALLRLFNSFNLTPWY